MYLKIFRWYKLYKASIVAVVNKRIIYHNNQSLLTSSLVLSKSQDKSIIRCMYSEILYSFHVIIKVTPNFGNVALLNSWTSIFKIFLIRILSISFRLSINSRSQRIMTTLNTTSTTSTLWSHTDTDIERLYYELCYRKAPRFVV